MSFEIDYYLTSTKQWLIDYAEAVTATAGEEAVVRGNTLVFPASIATGRYELYEVAGGLALWVVDCHYHVEVKHTRKRVLGNDHFCLMFNISEDPFNLQQESGDIVKTGKDLAGAVSFSSQSEGLQYVVKPGSHIRSVGLLFHYDWVAKILLQNKIPLQKSRLEPMGSNMPVQFSTNMDLKMRSVVEEVFSCKLSHYLKLRYFEGISIQLFTLFLRNILSEKNEKANVLSEEATRVMAFKKYLDTAISSLSDIPSMEDAIAHCKVSKSNFAKLFQHLFKDNYAEYIKKAKVRVGVRLIEEGYSITEAGRKIGYLNLGHFARIFQEKIGMTPKKYQQSLQQKARRQIKRN